MHGLEMIEFAKRKLCLEAVYMETKTGLRIFCLVTSGPMFFTILLFPWRPLEFRLLKNRVDAAISEEKGAAGVCG